MPKFAKYAPFVLQFLRGQNLDKLCEIHTFTPFNIYTGLKVGSI
jgi:hypothetical protein